MASHDPSSDDTAIWQHVNTILRPPLAPPPPSPCALGSPRSATSTGILIVKTIKRTRRYRFSGVNTKLTVLEWLGMAWNSEHRRTRGRRRCPTEMARGLFLFTWLFSSSARCVRVALSTNLEERGWEIGITGSLRAPLGTCGDLERAVVPSADRFLARVPLGPIVVRLWYLCPPPPPPFLSGLWYH